MKTAVILFNLGGPDTPKAVRPFLFNLFRDPAIIRLPLALRYLIALLIAGRRTRIAKEIYAKIGGASPILPNTQKQARALEEKLGDPDLKCFIAMRYWHPFTEEAVERVKRENPDRILLLPLYPQYSTTTTASSFHAWRAACRRAGLKKPTRAICCYPDEPGLIKAMAAGISAIYAEAERFGRPRILMSAHGLPEKIVASGDPYASQCEISAAALRAALNLPNLDAVLCYQSRVGPLKWIGPSTDDEIRRAGREKRPLIIIPLAFVSEHSETLVELDIEYRHLAEKEGVPFYHRAPTVSEHPDFISGLASLITKVCQKPEGHCLYGLKAEECADRFKGCAREQKICDV